MLVKVLAVYVQDLEQHADRRSWSCVWQRIYVQLRCTSLARRLAALEACSSCPLSRLELWGAVPLSAAVAEAVEARCPQLSYLYLNLFNWSSVEPPEEVASEHHHGCVQLLTLCGPRLRELHLLGVSDWQPLSYVALRRCTALVSLQLSANWDSSCKIRTPSDGGYGSGVVGCRTGLLLLYCRMAGDI